MGTNPVFYIQIADNEGEIAKLPGGGTLEKELVEALASAVKGRIIPIVRERFAVSSKDGVLNMGAWRSKARLAKMLDEIQVQIVKEISDGTDEFIGEALTDMIRSMKVASAKAIYRNA